MNILSLSLAITSRGRVEDNLYNSIEKLKEIFSKALYGDKPRNYENGIRRLFEDFRAIRLANFFKMLLENEQTVTIETCQAILNGTFESSSLPDDDIHRIIYDFNHGLSGFQIKYITKYVEKEGMDVGVIKTLKESMRFQNQADEVRQKAFKSPKILASKIKIPHKSKIPKARRHITVLPPPINPIDEFEDPEVAVSPFYPGHKNATQIIARDIFHVATKLADMKPEDYPFEANANTLLLIKIAKFCKLGQLTKKNAISLTNYVFLNQPCLPKDVHSTFIYHPTNKFFEDCFPQPDVNLRKSRELVLRGFGMITCIDGKDYSAEEHKKKMQACSNFVNTILKQ
jgi:hypothetical protein